MSAPARSTKPSTAATLQGSHSLSSLPLAPPRQLTTVDCARPPFTPSLSCRSLLFCSSRRSISCCSCCFWASRSPTLSCSCVPAACLPQQPDSSSVRETQDSQAYASPSASRASVAWSPCSMPSSAVSQPQGQACAFLAGHVPVLGTCCLSFVCCVSLLPNSAGFGALPGTAWALCWCTQLVCSR